MSNSWICVDASLIIKIVVEETLSGMARQLWRDWLEQELNIAAPPLLRYEVTSVLRKQVGQGLRTVPENRQALEYALTLDIHYIEPPMFYRRAFDLATTLNRPAAYDAHYLALASHLDCEFWTADKRLVNSVSDTFPWVHWLGQV